MNEYSNEDIKVFVMGVMNSLDISEFRLYLDEDISDDYELEITEETDMVHRYKLVPKKENKRYVTVELTEEEWEMNTIGGDKAHLYVSGIARNELPIVRGVEGGPAWGDRE